MKISVIGAGSFGTALAKVLADNGHEIHLWSYEKETADEINQNRINSIFLPDIVLPVNIVASSSLEDVLKGSRFVLSVVPTQVVSSVWENGKNFLEKDAILVSASKGIEKKTHRIVSDILEGILGADWKPNLAYLSGPTFARELAMKVPTAVTIAGYDESRIQEIQKIFHNEYFRAYGIHDVVGVELGGALKNVIAVATGVSDGLKLGYNTRAALITRGLAEIARLGVAMGAQPMTFMGLAGMGDLVLTCTGDLSRNRTVGIKLGQGMTLKDIMSEMKMVAEGVPTTESAYELSRIKNVDMPITEAMFRILYENKDPKDVIKDLMSRKLKFEHDH